MPANKIVLSENEIRSAISSTITMGAAAKFLKISERTFKKEAEKYGLYEPVFQKNNKFNLTDILDGKHPQYPTSKILPRLVSENYKKYECEKCGITKYNNEHISLELNHIDGDNSNHRLQNLQVLCPNCHSQTETYRSKKLKWRRNNVV